MDFIGGTRDQRQQTELKVVHFSLHIVHSRAVYVCVCGVNVCWRQVVVLAMDQLYLPGWCPPQTPPIVSRLLAVTTPLPPRYCSVVCDASVPSGGVQLGVGELVSALAAPSPLIAGANTILP